MWSKQDVKLGFLFSEGAPYCFATNDSYRSDPNTVAGLCLISHTGFGHAALLEINLMFLKVVAHGGTIWAPRTGVKQY